MTGLRIDRTAIGTFLSRPLGLKGFANDPAPSCSFASVSPLPCAADLCSKLVESSLKTGCDFDKRI
jgi:hypothetical protein